MIAIDVPQLAYKTWYIEHILYDKDGNRCYEDEINADRDLSRSLSHYKYNPTNEHVR